MFCNLLSIRQTHAGTALFARDCNSLKEHASDDSELFLEPILLDDPALYLGIYACSLEFDKVTNSTG